MLNPTKIEMIDSFHKVFLRGGAGFIGSHTSVVLLNPGVGVTVFVNFCNNNPLVLVGAAQITVKKPTLVQNDIIQESATFVTALRSNGASEVIQFKALKSVGQSVQNQLADYENNEAGCLNLLCDF